MSKFEELVNDYTLMGDDGAVIFTSYDKFLDFLEEIRADEREACAELCERFIGTTMVCQAERIQSAIRMRGNHEALDRMAADNQRMGLYDDAVNMSEERVHKTDKSIHEPVCFLRETSWSYEIAKWDDPNGFPVYAAPPQRKTLAELLASTPVDETAKGEHEQKTPLKVLNLTVFTENRLRNGRVYDVETLQGMTNRDILAIPDIGKKALAEVLEALAKLKEQNRG